MLSLCGILVDIRNSEVFAIQPCLNVLDQVGVTTIVW